MGKKNKKEQIIINNEELQTTTLGYLEDEKKGPWGLIILFSIFILVAIFLPNITNVVNKLLGKNTTGIIEPKVDPNKKDNNDDSEVIKMYDLSDSLVFEYNKIKFSDFKKYQENDNYYLSFKVENTSGNLLDFSKTKYFVETYNENKTLLERHIFKYSSLNDKAYTTQIFNLTNDEYNSLNKIMISLKTNEDYADVTLKMNTNQEYVLSCSNSSNTLIYSFDKDNKLLRINDTVNYNNDNSTKYSNTLLNYRNLVVSNNNKDGISSSLVEILTGFTFTTDINVKVANISELNNDNYYETNSIPKEVKFEMESRGYSCN